MTSIQIRKDITIEQGADFTEPFSLPFPSIALAGARFAMQFRASYGDATALATLTTWGGTLDLDAVSRTLTPLVSEEVSAALPAGTIVYDVKMQDADGYTSFPFYGNAVVRPVVTTLPFPSPSPGAGGQLDFSIAGNSGLIGVL